MRACCRQRACRRARQVEMPGPDGDSHRVVRKLALKNGGQVDAEGQRDVQLLRACTAPNPRLPSAGWQFADTSEVVHRIRTLPPGIPHSMPARKSRPQRNAAAARWGILGISVKESSARRAIAVDSITGSGVISPGGQRRTSSPDRFLTFSSAGSRRSRPSPTRVRSPATGCTCRSSRCGRPNRSSADPRPWPRRSPPGRCPPFRRSGGK